ncbi:MAG: peptide ABC transporter substrate-binding protein [Pasteurellaceae bacterium]|nr:peptide ABC transporter substrate-binding protein [Pasteurellaceae bacterium]
MPSLKNKFIVFAFIGSFACLTACDRHKTEVNPITTTHSAVQSIQPKQDDAVLKRATYEPLTLDLAQLQRVDQASLLRDVREGLVIADRQGNILPGVAEKWQTADNKVWIFQLRQNAKWSNGEKITAQDIIRSWQHLAQSTSPLKQYLALMNISNASAVLNKQLPVERLGINALDENTLRIELDKATPYLPQMLLHPALLLEYHNPNPNELIGNGAYQVAQRQDKQILLIKNPYYWHKDQVTFEQVQYQQIDAMQKINGFDWVEQPKMLDETTLLTYLPRLCTYFYEFNFNDPALSQKPVRQALVSMVSVLNLLPTDPKMLINSANFLPRNMQFKQERDWQPTFIEQQLKQAGFSEKHPLTLRISYDNDGLHKLLAERLIQAWSQSDLIVIKADPLTYQQLLAKRAKGDFQIIRAGWCADYNEPSAFLNLLYSYNADNKVHFYNEKIDQLLQKSLSPTLSQAQRTQLYQQIMLIVQQEYAQLSLFQYTKPIYIAPRIAGYQISNPSEVFYSKDLRGKKF